ncbi:MAG: hypothetical protein EB027_07955, partial [Actinobacteria bacterium]|nr:hypothetical protein [Actinomycetota bacterium]
MASALSPTVSSSARATIDLNTVEVRAGATYSVTLTPSSGTAKTVSYTAVAADTTQTALATKIAQAITAAGGGYSATASGDTITVSANVASVTPSFSATGRLTAPDRGIIALGSTSSGKRVVAFSDVELAPVGSLYTLTLGSTPFTYTRQAGDGTLQKILEGLAQAVDQDAQLAASARVATVANTWDGLLGRLETLIDAGESTLNASFDSARRRLIITARADNTPFSLGDAWVSKISTLVDNAVIPVQLGGSGSNQVNELVFDGFASGDPFDSTVGVVIDGKFYSFAGSTFNPFGSATVSQPASVPTLPTSAAADTITTTRSGTTVTIDLANVGTLVNGSTYKLSIYYTEDNVENSYDVEVLVTDAIIGA